LRSLLASRLPRSLPPALATEAGSLPSTLRLPFRRLAGVAVGAALVLAAVLARGSVGDAAAILEGLRPFPLALAGVALVVTLAASAAAWRSALLSAGAELRFREAWGCYGIGSLANAVLPARLGEAVRIGLFANRVDHADRRWLSGGACLAVAGARAVVYTTTCVLATLAGVLPAWTLSGPAIALGAAALGLSAFRRRLRRLGVGAVLTWPRGSALLGWAALSAVCRLGAATCVLAALDVGHPLRSALLGLGALAVAGTLPIAPGGVGVAGAGMALALHSSGIPVATAAAAALAFHAVETLASLLFGSTGWLALRRLPRAGRV
jgi:uncharacterized membrane protein YbhN (UPF0104 family)